MHSNNNNNKKKKKKNSGVIGSEWNEFLSCQEQHLYKKTQKGFMSDTLLVSYKARCSGLFLFWLYTRSPDNVTFSHGFFYTVILMTLKSYDFPGYSLMLSKLSIPAVHHLKLNPGKTEMLYISQKAHPHLKNHKTMVYCWAISYCAQQMLQTLLSHAAFSFMASGGQRWGHLDNCWLLVLALVWSSCL